MPKFIEVNCNYCTNAFNQTKQRFNRNKLRNTLNYCSMDCSLKARNKCKKLNCETCNKEFIKTNGNFTTTNHHFCSKRCSGIYFNKHKTHGYRRSKLEIFLQQKIEEVYGINFAVFNGVTEIKSELDIYIPSLKLAFELNGIFHYEPIYGEDKLKSIKNNDSRKFQACIENKISLCIIDSSKMKYFKEDKSIEYFKIIQDIIQKETETKR